MAGVIGRGIGRRPLPGYIGSYSFNGWLYSSPDLFPHGNTKGIGPTDDLAGTSPSWQYMTESSVLNPTTVPVLADSVEWDSFPTELQGPAKDLYNGCSLAGRDMARYTVARHGTRAPGKLAITSSVGIPGSINTLFFEGHASSTKLQDLWTLNWHAGWTPPANHTRSCSARFFHKLTWGACRVLFFKPRLEIMTLQECNRDRQAARMVSKQMKKIIHFIICSLWVLGFNGMRMNCRLR